MLPQSNAQRIRLSDIDVSDRLRGVSEDFAQVLAVSIREDGQQTPIEVRPFPGGDGPFKYRLTFGAHRYRACEINQAEEIDAVVFVIGEREARLREIDENLMRRELTALDRARNLLERKRVHEELYPETKHGGERPKGQAANLATRFTADVAERIGLGERTVQRACEIAEKLSPELFARIEHSALANNQAALEALAKQPAERQRAAVDLMFAQENPAKSVADALGRLDGRTEKTADDGNKVAKFVDMWGRLGARDRRAVLSFLASAELPAGCKVSVKAGGE